MFRYELYGFVAVRLALLCRSALAQIYTDQEIAAEFHLCRVHKLSGTVGRAKNHARLFFRENMATLLLLLDSPFRVAAVMPHGSWQQLLRLLPLRSWQSSWPIVVLEG